VKPSKDFGDLPGLRESVLESIRPTQASTTELPLRSASRPQEEAGRREGYEKLAFARDETRSATSQERSTIEELLTKRASAAAVEPGRPAPWPRPPSKIQFEDLGSSIRELMPTTLRPSDAVEASHDDPSTQVKPASRVVASQRRRLTSDLLDNGLSSVRSDGLRNEATRQHDPTPKIQAARSTRAAAQNQAAPQRVDSTRLQINRLDIQIINQPAAAVAPPSPPPPLPPPASDLWDTLDRHHLGNAGLML
jgi:hypothetical protein